MTKRLQVLLEEAEMRAIQRAARAEHITVAEWVRRALRSAREGGPSGSVTKKLAVLHAASRHRFPTADIDQMNAEIARGYGELP